MRGVAIWLVIIGHLIQYNNCNDWMHNPVFEWIYSFHMPLFFYISGYMAVKTTTITNYSDFFNFIGKKIRTLIVPLVVWSLIANRYFFAKDIVDFKLIDLWNVFYLRDLWFLKYLFVVSVLYGLFHFIQTKWNKDLTIWKDLVTSGIIFFMLFCCSWFVLSSMFRSFALFYFFFMIGVFVSKHSNIESLWNNKYVYALAFFLFCMLSTHWNSDGNTLDDLIKVIVAPCSFIVLNTLCKIVEHLRFSNALAYIGRYSLIIYCSHWAFLTIIQNQIWDFSLMNNFWLFGMCAIIAMPVCFACVFFAKIIERNNILAFLFMGKKYSNGK